MSKMGPNLAKLIFSVLCCLWITQANAGVAIIDGKIAVQHITQPELLVLCSKKQTTLILNRTDFDNPGAGAGWSTMLQPFQCAIFFAHQSPFDFSCSQESSGAWAQVDCSQYLLASRFPWNGALLSGDMPEVSFWVAENIASDDIPMVLRHRGFDV